MLVRLKRGLYVFLAITFFLCINTRSLHADSRSTNYKLNESVIGAGGLNQSSSASYVGRDSIGSLGVGTSASSSYQVQAGSTTTNDPSLSVAVGGASVNFTSFSASTPTTATATFSILNYTSYGYIVQLVGNPPSNGSTTINAMTTTGPSVAGTSQFGVNLVANTSPVSVGANPNTGQFGFGSASANYGTSNQYRYVSGETIAQSTKSSGVTTYTITYLVNVAPLTPGGIYTSNQTLIITGTY